MTVLIENWITTYVCLAYNSITSLFEIGAEGKETWKIVTSKVGKQSIIFC